MAEISPHKALLQRNSFIYFSDWFRFAHAGDFLLHIFALLCRDGENVCSRKCFVSKEGEESKTNELWIYSQEKAESANLFFLESTVQPRRNFF